MTWNIYSFSTINTEIHVYLGLPLITDSPFNCDSIATTKCTNWCLLYMFKLILPYLIIN